MKLPTPLIVMSEDSSAARDFFSRRAARGPRGPDVFRFDGSDRSLKELDARVRKEKPEWLLFEKNEQNGNWPVAKLNRRYHTGYSSFSGIDAPRLREQTDSAWDDWRNPGKFELKSSRKPAPERRISPALVQKKQPVLPSGTFSLLFDTEQLGGVRFGLPRILELLDRVGVRATFFITGVVQHVHPGLVRTLQRAGHEVGLHGLCHEYLQGMDAKRQAGRIRMQKDATPGARGVNFIGRMDSTSVRAFHDAGMEYFVFPLKNNRSVWAAYSPPLWTQPGLWAVPVFAETYGKSWEKIRTELDLTLAHALKNGLTPRIPVLGHPFFDGSAARLPVLNGAIDYLKRQGLQGIPLCESLPRPPIRAGPGRIDLRPYGASGLNGVLERIQNGRTLATYARLLENGHCPRVKCV